jgi:hypothetical protein
MLIPCSRGLFQTIQSFLEFKNVVWKLGTLKTRGYLTYTCLYIPIQKGTFDIHLKKLKPFEAAKAKRILMAPKRATRAKVSS